MKKLVAARIDEDIVKSIKKMANENNRSFSNQVEVILGNVAKARDSDKSKPGAVHY